MVVGEVSLGRIEELLLGFAHELRPALAIGDPSVPFADRGHFSSVVAARRHFVRPPSASFGVPPVFTGGRMLRGR
jgi:hypothetical protein